MNVIYCLAFLVVLQFSSCSDRPLQLPQSSARPDSVQVQKRDNAVDANIVFRSTDGGQTWQDISEGLPEPVKNKDGVGRSASFADDNGLYLTAGNRIYYNKPNATAPFWTKEIYPDEHSSISPGKTGIFAYNLGESGILHKTNGTSKWSPIYTNFQQKGIRSVFESAAGSIFIGADGGLFKSTYNGKTWKQVHTSGLAMKVVESTGVLMAINSNGIIRSTDDGENWDWVIREDRRGFSVDSIKGGFAVSFDKTESDARSVRTTYDGGKTWQFIDAGLPASHSIFSIIQVGENFFCGHPEGVFRSSDKGKTWKLLLPTVDGKAFILSVSGNVIYAVPRRGGC